MCLTNLIEFSEGKIDECRGIDIICMTFSKAFDNVSHGKLLCKVRSCGILGVLVNYIPGDSEWCWKITFQIGGI